LAGKQGRQYQGRGERAGAFIMAPTTDSAFAHGLPDREKLVCIGQKHRTSRVVAPRGLLLAYAEAVTAGRSRIELRDIPSSREDALELTE
jgi:hypothetical protein